MKVKVKNRVWFLKVIFTMTSKEDPAVQPPKCKVHKSCSPLQLIEWIELTSHFVANIEKIFKFQVEGVFLLFIYLFTI